MSFYQVSSTFEHYLELEAFIGLLLCGLIFFTLEGKMPSGSLKKRFSLLIFITFISFVLLRVGLIQLEGFNNRFFMMLWFAVIISLPVLTAILMSWDMPGGNGVKNSLVFLLLLNAVSLFTPGVPPVFNPAVFIAGLLLSIAYLLLLQKSLINEASRSYTLGLASGVFTAGVCILFDWLALGVWQEIPFVSFFGIFWCFVIVGGSMDTGKERKISPGMFVDYLLIPVSILFTVLLYALVDYILDIWKKPLWTAENHTLTAVFIALALASLYGVFRKIFTGALDWLSDRTMSRLAGALRDAEHRGIPPVGPHEINRFASRYGDIECQVWQRKRNSRFYRPVGEILDYFTDNEKMTIDDRIWEKAGEDRFFLINPLNVQEFGSRCRVFGRILRLADTRHILISFPNRPEYGIPTGFYLFIGGENKPVAHNSIKDLCHLASMADIEAQRSWKSRNIQVYVSMAGNIRGMDMEVIASEIEKNRGYIFPFENGDLYVNYPESGQFQRYHLGGIETIIDLDDIPHRMETGKDDFGYVFKGDSFMAGIMEIPSSSCHAFLVVRLNQDFIYEEGDISRISSILSDLGLLVDSAVLVRSFRRQARELEQAYEERTRFVADSIHDNIAQEIYAARMQVHLMEKTIGEKMPGSMEEIEMLKTTVSEGLKNTRNLLNQLRTGIHDVNDSPGIMDLISRMESERGIVFHLEGLEILNGMESDLGLDFERFVRELLNNIRKHAADAGSVYLRIKRDKYGIKLLIVDNGKGFDPATERAGVERGYGLSSIHTRCVERGYTFLIRSIQGKGTAVKIQGSAPP